MRLCIVLIGMAAAVTACSSQQATHWPNQATQSEAQAPMVSLVAEEAASVTRSYGVSDPQIVKQIVAASIAGYSGKCPCPYNRKSNGASCGRSSAHDRPGGASVICYPQEVTPEMIQAHRILMN